MNANDNKNSPFFAGNKNKWFKPRGYYVHSYNNFDMTVHSHSRIEIMYVFTGEVQIEYQIPGEEWKKTTIIPSNYVFIDANIPHKISINNITTTIYNIELSLTDSSDLGFSIGGMCSKESFVNSFFNKKRDLFVCSDDGLFLQNLLIVQKYIGNEINNVHDSYLNYLLSALLLLLAKQFKQSKKHVGTVYVNTAVNYIYENYNRDITLSSLAEICGISPNYLNTLFSQSFGCTFKEYFNRYRITRACLLLSSTNLPIDDIRAQVGYHNKICFNQNFLKYAGKSPKKYRQEVQSINIAKTHAEGSANTYWNV
ncbi:MAG: helix-turn-helix transcriptional regulator [Clostridia bacterium]|nr:helix-turn-helix transcriptional regulator [Clostridia bacterium]